MYPSSRVILLALVLSSCGSGDTSSTGSVPLKTLAERRGIRFGSLYQYDIRTSAYDQLFETEMGVMALGVFWVNGVHGDSRYVFQFAELDAQVDWGRARGMVLPAQTLVWFEDIPEWVKSADAAAVETVMYEHIDTVVGRYKGRVDAWNVVNEAVGDDGTLRMGHKWVDAMGNDYIRKAFVRAKAADPGAVLYYNDYDMENNQPKYEGVKSLLIGLKDAGVPVDGLGWQLHVKPSSFVAGTLLARMNEIADLGFDNYITELDVELPPAAVEADYRQQKETYKTIIQTFLTARRHKSIVVWGLRDGDPYWLTNGHPLLFDENLGRKPAYFGVQEALE
ncbi:MAG: endo-1,4-beta-xylanase [Planctomycetes bacterium]|nr:endo-1,4-beta-xylanase [Planctomycetota bacterium]